MTEAVAKLPQAFPFLDLLSWADSEPDERFFLVPGLIPGGCVTSLYGDGGSGKTLIALWLMVCMASRSTAKWLGETPLGWKSVGLFAEDDGDEIIRRLHRICHAVGVEFAAVASSIVVLPGVGIDTVVAFFDDTGDLMLTPLMDALLHRVRAESASLLVLDYAAAIFEGSELDRSQVSAFMRRLNALAQEHDIAILLLGHPSVDGMKGGRGTSGSTAWRNQARAFLHLSVDEVQDDPEERRLLTLALTKSNYSRAGKTFRLASDGSRFDVLEAAEGTPRKERGARLSASQKIALKALNQCIADGAVRSPGGPIPTNVQCAKTALWREYAYRMEISDSSPEARKKAFSRAVKELIAKGVVGVVEPLAWIMDGGANEGGQIVLRDCPGGGQQGHPYRGCVPSVPSPSGGECPRPGVPDRRRRRLANRWGSRGRLVVGRDRLQLASFLTLRPRSSTDLVSP